MGESVLAHGRGPAGDGQSLSTPLVAYTYDAIGNQQTVTTRSDSSTSRATGYDYDSGNRVTKIEYPGGIVGDHTCPR